VRSKKSPPPLVHTTSVELERRYLLARAEFLRGYRETARQHAALPVAKWPADAFTPSSRFITVSDTPSLLSMLTTWQS
jgi:hypothetical protein